MATATTSGKLTFPYSLTSNSEPKTDVDFRTRVHPAPTHAYPTSSKTRTNWDALAKKALAEEEEGASAASKDPNAGGDKALNELFQKLYADATDEQRRAMVKSYQESNGTALSTDWSSVAKVCAAFTLLAQLKCLHLV